jgi:hypothetical protein
VSTPGCDYSVGWRAGVGGELRRAGLQFAIRYLSGGHPKDLTAPERDDLLSAGMAICLVWETDGRTGPLAGAAGASGDAAAAIAQAKILGAPRGTCLFFSVDFSPSSAQLTQVRSYARQAAADCHEAGFRCGIYGGRATVAACDTLCDLLWQTPAWSNGVWVGAAVLRQGAQQLVAGVTVDLDQALTADFGQWTRTPQEDPSMLVVNVVQNGTAMDYLLFDDGRAAYIESQQALSALTAALPSVPLDPKTWANIEALHQPVAGP